ncbi:MAG TPA: hypothetical protein VM054_04025 [bacterium]|nr:hypothetical protein [bacterium]
MYAGFGFIEGGPLRRPAGDLRGGGVVICEAELLYTDDAGDWGEPTLCFFCMMRFDGVWKVTLWKERD